MIIQRLTALPFTTRPRAYAPRLWIIHATRGPAPHEDQGRSTIDWFTRSAPDNGGWGATADVLIDHAGNVYEFRDIPNERGAYSAGYGFNGYPYDVAADEYGISIELAQSAALEPYSPATIDALVDYIRQRTKDWGLDIPAVRINSWSQLASQSVPAGFIGHEDTANGRRSGKTDPGPLFPWGDVLARVAAQPKHLDKDTHIGALVSGHYLDGQPYQGVYGRKPVFVRNEDGGQVYELWVK